MNPEAQFEERLRRQPLRKVPADWRAEIMSAAHTAGSRPSAFTPRPSLLSTLFSPHPKAWAGLAAVWVVILSLQFASRDRTEVVARTTPPPSPEMLMALRQQKLLLLAELVEQPEPRAADRPKALPPRPRSQLRPQFLNI